jgi:hypothetical protein
MAERYLIASGPVSNPANWFGGNKPTVGDVAHANGFTGTVDEDISADTWTTAAGVTAVAGGGFTLLDGFTLTGQIQSTTGFCVTYAGTGTANIVGNLVANPSGAGVPVMFDTGTVGTLIVTGGSFGGAGNARGVLYRGAPGALLRVTGDAVGGSASTGNGIRIDTAATGGTVEVMGSVRGGLTASQGVNIVGKLDRLFVGGSCLGEVSHGLLINTASSASDGLEVEVMGSAVGSRDTNGRGIQDAGEFAKTILVHGSAVGLNSQGIWLTPSAGETELTVRGGANGGYSTESSGIRSASSIAMVTVNGYAVGGSHPNAHGILNMSTGSVRIGGQAITNPSGALGVSNPGNGQVVIGYADFFEPVKRFITEGVTPRSVIGSWAKNATHITVDNPTIDVKDFSFTSITGGPQPMTVDATDNRLMKYEHGSNIFSRNNLYFLIFGGEHEGQQIPETIHPIRF